MQVEDFEKRHEYKLNRLRDLLIDDILDYLDFLVTNGKT